MPFYSSQFTGAKRCLVAKRDNFYYIPLLDTLKSLLSIDSIVNEITEPRPSSRLPHDFSDGVILGTHPLFSND